MEKQMALEIYWRLLYNFSAEKIKLLFKSFIH